jgi:hypothetical protein
VKLEVGQVKVWHKLITVEIGTEARLRQLQQGLPSPVLIGRAQAPSLPVGRKPPSVKPHLTVCVSRHFPGVMQATVRDESFDRIEQLADVGLAMYLAKRRDSALAAIERAHTVTITPMWGHSLAREVQGLAFVRIGGQTLDAVELAWQCVESLIQHVVRRKAQFKFAPDEALARKCFKAKLKQLNDSRDCPTTIFFDDRQQVAVTVHVLGGNANDVKAQDPNHVRSRIHVDKTSLRLPPSSTGRSAPDWSELAKLHDVIIESADCGVVAVAGYRDAVTKCVAHIVGLLSPSGSASAPAPAPAATLVTAPAIASDSTLAGDEVRLPTTATLEYTPDEAESVAKLQPAVVEAKFDVRVQLDRQLGAITVSSVQSPSVARAIKYIRYRTCLHTQDTRHTRHAALFTLKTGSGSGEAPRRALRRLTLKPPKSPLLLRERWREWQLPRFIRRRSTARHHLQLTKLGLGQLKLKVTTQRSTGPCSSTKQRSARPDTSYKLLEAVVQDLLS